MLNKQLEQQLLPNEQIIVIIREYIITKFFSLSVLSVIYLSLFFTMYFLFSLGSWGVLVFFLGLAIVVFFIVRLLTMWYLDTMIVTDLRLLDIEQSGIFSKRVQEIPWPSVADIQYQQRGLFATLCGYGTIFIYTSLLPEPIELQHVYHPKQIRDIISEHAKQTNS